MQSYKVWIPLSRTVQVDGKKKVTALIGSLVVPDPSTKIAERSLASQFGMGYGALARRMAVTERLPCRVEPIGGGVPESG